jgi:hypothetical protein
MSYVYEYALRRVDPRLLKFPAQPMVLGGSEVVHLINVLLKVLCPHGICE